MGRCGSGAGSAGVRGVVSDVEKCAVHRVRGEVKVNGVSVSVSVAKVRRESMMRCTVR